jgi:hypothetical protein
MLSKKLKGIADSKLTKVLNQITTAQVTGKTGFLAATNKSSLFKTKSFRLREADVANLKNIISCVNNNDGRMQYSDSQIIRGLINYFSDNADTNIKKIMPYIISSS